MLISFNLKHLVVNVCVCLPEDGADANGGALVVDVVGEESERRIALVLDAGVDDAAGEQSARLHKVLVRVQVLVDLGEADLDVPQRDESERGGGAHDAVVLVLVYPGVGLLVVAHKLILAEAGVEEAVDERRGQILSRRVHLGLIRRPVGLQVRLVDVLGHLGLHDVQLARQVQEVLAETRVVHDLAQLVGLLHSLAIELPVDLLTAEQKGQLFAHKRVLARVEHLLDEVHVVELNGAAECERVLSELQVQLVRCGQQNRVLRLGHIRHTTFK